MPCVILATIVALEYVRRGHTYMTSYGDVGSLLPQFLKPEACLGGKKKKQKDIF